MSPASIALPAGGPLAARGRRVDHHATLLGGLPPWGVLRGGNPALSLGLPFVSFICGTVAALCLLVACLSRRWGAWGCGLWALGLAWLRVRLGPCCFIHKK